VNAANPSRMQRGTVIQCSEKERFFKISDPRYQMHAGSVCVTVRTIVVAAYKFVGGCGTGSIELERIQVNIKSCDLKNLNLHGRKYTSSIKRVSE